MAQKADITMAIEGVRQGPATEVADSFDYLVGPQDRRRVGKQFYESLASPIA